MTGLPNRIQNLSQTSRLHINKWGEEGIQRSPRVERRAWENMWKGMYRKSFSLRPARHHFRVQLHTPAPENIYSFREFKKAHFFPWKDNSRRDLNVCKSPKYFNVAQTSTEEGEDPGLIPSSTLLNGYLPFFPEINAWVQPRNVGSLGWYDAAAQQPEHSQNSAHLLTLGLYFPLVVIWNTESWEVGLEPCRPGESRF